MMKDIWINSFETLVEEYIDQGMTREQAEKLAEDEAYDHSCETLYSQADFLRKQAKEG